MGTRKMHINGWGERAQEHLHTHLVRLARVPERPGRASSFGGTVQRKGRVELRRNLLESLVIGGQLPEDAQGVVLELRPKLLRNRGAAKWKLATQSPKTNGDDELHQRELEARRERCNTLGGAGGWEEIKSDRADERGAGERGCSCSCPTLVFVSGPPVRQPYPVCLPRLNQPRGTSSQLDTKLLFNLTMLYSVLRAHRQLRKLKR